jgi:hypothetical protein
MRCQKAEGNYGHLGLGLGDVEGASCEVSGNWVARHVRGRAKALVRRGPRFAVAVELAAALQVVCLPDGVREVDVVSTGFTCMGSPGRATRSFAWVDVERGERSHGGRGLGRSWRAEGW